MRAVTLAPIIRARPRHLPNRHPIEFRKGLETLFITLDEPNKQMRRLLTKEERLKKPYLRDDQKWTQTVEPSGDLRIQIKSYERGSVLFEFRDEPGAPLENNIRAVFESFMRGLDKVRKERAKREEQSKRWAEAPEPLRHWVIPGRRITLDENNMYTFFIFLLCHPVSFIFPQLL